jgi:hypothetical protein
MGNAFAWLDQLMTWLGKWVPRLVLIPPTHKGVRFGPRGGVRELAAGLVVYWPITHSLLQVPVTTQSFQLCTQVLPVIETDGGSLFPRAVIFGAAIQFRVDDAVKASTQALHLHALVDNRASAAIAKHSDPTLKPVDWVGLAFDTLKQELRVYGVTLERLDLTQGAIGIAVKNLSDWNYADNVKGEHAWAEERRN